MPYQTKDGRWRAVRMIHGQRKTKLCKTKSEAKKWEAEQHEELWQVQTNTICLLDLATAYLDYSKARHHANTFAAKQVALKRLFQFVRADAQPDAVTARVALAYMMDRAKKHGNAAANKDRKHMAACWEYGKKYYGLTSNPFRDLEKLPEDSQPHYVPPIEDFWKVYAVANAQDKVLLLALLYTAGRRSEPLRWTWADDIDLKNRKIRLSTCKTADGSRKYEWLTMSSRLHEALVEHKLRTGGRGHVFQNEQGEGFKDKKHTVTRLCAKACVKRFNFHGIRGLCATLLAAGGVPMKEIQHVLLHSKMTTTDLYVRRIGGTSDILAAAFDRFEETATTAGKIVPFQPLKKLV